MNQYNQLYYKIIIGSVFVIALSSIYRLFFNPHSLESFQGHKSAGELFPPFPLKIEAETSQELKMSAIEGSEKKYRHVAYYITGHGLGHATRSLELIRGLLFTGRYIVHTITTVDGKFFTNELKAYNISLEDDNGTKLYSNWYRNLDTGGIQKDVIYLDPLKTIDTYYHTVYAHREELLSKEVDFLKEYQIDIVLMDATHLGAKAASLAGIPSAFVSNFTWDFILREMLKIVQTEVSEKDQVEYERMIATASEDVNTATYMIQYLGATPLPDGFAQEKIIPAPLITRPLKNANLRNELGIKSNEKVLLLGFGGHSTSWQLDDSYLPEDWVCLVLRANPADMPSNRFRVMPDDSYVPDLIHAADVVLGKIGYGFVSECLAAGRSLLYIPRVAWPEEAYLEEVLAQQYSCGVKVPLVDYNAGQWRTYMEQGLARKESWVIEEERHPSTATAKVVAIIESILAKESSNNA
jgi:L-arabinokinase